MAEALTEGSDALGKTRCEYVANVIFRLRHWLLRTRWSKPTSAESEVSRDTEVYATTNLG